MMQTLSRDLLYCFYPIFRILSGNEDMHKSLDEFEIPSDRTIDHEAALEYLKINVFPFSFAINR